MKKVLLFLSIMVMAFGLQSQTIQSDFFKKVSFIGAFGYENWTTGWANFDPQNTNYPAPTATLGNGELSYANGTKITSNITIEGVVKLDGWVYVTNGATLTIKKGTIIRGSTAAALIVERGGKIIAEGTKEEPIVFTSIKPAGSRAPSDWGGIIICGKASNNRGNDVTIEGGVGAQYGIGTGPAIENDNSGILKYVRIEFPGYDVDGAGNEINGLTMGSVGSGTTIEYVQVSYSGDDAFEWFGGSVNCRYLIALATEDDDFDSDFGYCGNVQFALAVRDSKVSDTDGGRGFESDNDAASSYRTPYTTAVFSNVTLIGPGIDESTNKKHDVALLLRRNTRLQIYNLVATKFVKGGLVISGDPTQKAAVDDSLIIKHSVLAGFGGVGSANPAVTRSGSANPLSDAYSWFLDQNKKNDTTAFDNLKITFPVNLANPSFLPGANSILLTKGSYWGMPVTNVTVSSPKDTIKINESIQLTATISPENAAIKDVEWSILDGQNVASLSNTGLVQGLSAGKVVIKASSLENPNISDTIEINVSSIVNVKNISQLVSIHPNPAFDKIIVQSLSHINNIEIYDILGKTNKVIRNINDTKVKITISDFNKGLYILKVTYADGNSEIHKFFKK